MRILFNPTIKYTPSFFAKKKEIRKADDIQRKARTAVPFFSPNYAKKYFPKTVSTYVGKKISMNKAEELNVIRQERAYFQRNSSLPVLMQKVINDTRREKIANCGEASLITMSTLLANGYSDTHRCAVVLSNEIVDKKTGYLCFIESYDLDHSCVLSTMSKRGERKPYVVLDSWHGFADSMSAARARYLQLTKKEELEEYKNAAISAFEEKTQQKIDFDRYKVKQNIDFVIIDSSTKEEGQFIQNVFKKKYKKLIFDEKSKD